MKIDFVVAESGTPFPSGMPSQAVLFHEKWDDWFKYQTQYGLWVCDDNRTWCYVGKVKIGQKDMTSRVPDIPPTFSELDERFFSIGQDVSYYEKLVELGDDIRETVLRSLKDMAGDRKIYEVAVGEKVGRESLMRSLSETEVSGPFRRLAGGGDDPLLFRFTLGYCGFSDAAPWEIALQLELKSKPPTNVHVLIGRNGSGKSYLLNKIAELTIEDGEPQQDFQFTSHRERVANVVAVSFSAFDRFPFRDDRDPTEELVGYASIGLRKKDSPTSPIHLKTSEALDSEFAESVVKCLSDDHPKERLLEALKILQSDPTIQILDLASTFDRFSNPDTAKAQAIEIFSELSSGHKLILLTMTKLVEKVEERTLVLLDEPESHLHPPLLAAFMRALSSLLHRRKGIAVIATHSPVVLQEVPKNCVWIIRRDGHITTVRRPDLETFGENVSTLTDEIFRLEVKESGFHGLLKETVEAGGTYESIVKEYEGRLGAEARALLRALIAGRDRI